MCSYVWATAKTYEIEPLFREARLFKSDWPVGVAPAALAAWAAPERPTCPCESLRSAEKSPRLMGRGSMGRAARHPVTHYGPQDASSGMTGNAGCGVAERGRIDNGRGAVLFRTKHNVLVDNPAMTRMGLRRAIQKGPYSATNLMRGLILFVGAQGRHPHSPDPRED